MRRARPARDRTTLPAASIRRPCLWRSHVWATYEEAPPNRWSGGAVAPFGTRQLLTLRFLARNGGLAIRQGRDGGDNRYQGRAHHYRSGVSDERAARAVECSLRVRRLGARVKDSRGRLGAGCAVRDARYARQRVRIDRGDRSPALLS